MSRCTVHLTYVTFHINEIVQGGAKKVEHFIFIRYVVTSHTYAKLMRHVDSSYTANQKMFNTIIITV